MTQLVPLTVRSGDCRGVTVLLDPARAVPGQVVKVAGAYPHRVTRCGSGLSLVACQPRRDAISRVATGAGQATGA